MTKLKTLLLLVLAGFILVACGSDEEAVEAEVVDPRADAKAAVAELVAADDEVDSNTADCVANAMSENLDDDEWALLTLLVQAENDGNFDPVEEFLLENGRLDVGAIDFALEKANVACGTDLD
tara:strand:+ start:1384 stop:1752 length:369 start_codon:yes stop_codon:yes gene_type:complete